MKNKSFLGLLLFSCICLTAIAQETTKPVKAIYVNADQNILFDKLIDFVQNNEYFILSLDKQAGFIQAQKPVEIKKVFKPNERRTLNFVIRPINENLSQITLNIRCEEKHWGGSESGHVYYYDDKGVSQNSDLYQNIWDELKSALVPYQQVIFTTVTTPAPTKALPAETTLTEAKRGTSWKQKRRAFMHPLVAGKCISIHDPETTKRTYRYPRLGRVPGETL